MNKSNFVEENVFDLFVYPRFHKLLTSCNAVIGGVYSLYRLTVTVTNENGLISG